MDIIWLSALTILVHLCSNWIFGTSRGWHRLVQWPVIFLITLVVEHVRAAVPWRWFGLEQASIAALLIWLAVIAAVAAAVVVRRYC